MRRLGRCFALSTLLFAAVTTPTSAAVIDVTLGFASLPSAQGWTYVPSGSHATAVEATVFSVAGGVLTQNSIGQSNGVAGGSIFYQRSGGLTTTEAKQMRVSMRCLAVQTSTNAPSGQGGTFFGFTTGAAQYGFSITPTQVFMLTASGFVQTASGLDNSSAFHDYVLEYASPGTTRVYRDGSLQGTATSGFAVAANRIIFGDGTGGANANVQMRSLRFIQDTATLASSSSWGRLKALYR